MGLVVDVRVNLIGPYDILTVVTPNVLVYVWTETVSSSEGVCKHMVCRVVKVAEG